MSKFSWIRAIHIFLPSCKDSFLLTRSRFFKISLDLRFINKYLINLDCWKQIFKRLLTCTKALNTETLQRSWEFILVWQNFNGFRHYIERNRVRCSLRPASASWAFDGVFRAYGEGWVGTFCDDYGSLGYPRRESLLYRTNSTLI